MRTLFLMLFILGTGLLKAQDTLTLFLDSKQVYNVVIRQEEVPKDYCMSKTLLKRKYKTIQLTYKQKDLQAAYKNSMQFSFTDKNGKEWTDTKEAVKGKFSFKSKELIAALLNKNVLTITLFQDPANPKMMIASRRTPLLVIKMK